jgi:hypothetical protein
MLLVTRDPRDHEWGSFIYVNFDAANPNTDPKASQETYYWNNNVWAAQRYHRDRVCTVFADTHAKTVNNIYMPPNSSYTYWSNWDPEKKAFWGDDVSATK